MLPEPGSRDIDVLGQPEYGHLYKFMVWVDLAMVVTARLVSWARMSGGEDLRVTRAEQQLLTPRSR